MASKKCLECDAVIGENEKVCPACQTDLEELEQTVAAVEKANKVIAKRAAAVPPPEPESEPEPETKVSIFRRLALKRKEK